MLSGVFVLLKLAHLVVVLTAPRFVNYLGSFAYVRDLSSYQLPSVVSAWANFDGLYYLRIAQSGYQQYEQVFFPLYPLLIRLTAPIFLGNKLLAGLFLSNFSLILALWLFYRFLKNSGHKTAGLAIVFLLAFPTAFFFGAVYTESLFLLLVVLTFFLLRARRLFLAGLVTYFAALTRLMGVFLFIPLALYLLSKLKNIPRWWEWGILVFPFLGLLTYMGYLHFTTGDSLAFFHAQSVFGEARSTSFVLLPQVYFRYFKIFFSADWSFQYFVSLLEFVIFSLVLGVLILDLKTRIKKPNYLLISLNLFSFINILLPTLTGSFMSVPRFALLSLSFFVYLSQLKNKLVIGLLSGSFFILQLILLSFFIQGYFVS